MESIAECAGKMEDVCKLEELLLAARDDCGDDRWIKNKLNKVVDWGAADVEKEILGM